MFNFFKKPEPPPLPPAGEPHPQNTYLARSFLPDCFHDESKRDNLIRVLISDHREAMLKKVWTEFGKDSLPATRLLAADGIRVHPMRLSHGMAFCFEFPTTGAPEEVAYSVVVCSPLDLAALPESFQDAEFRYFYYMVMSGHEAGVLEWMTADKPGKIIGVMSGTPGTKSAFLAPDFVRFVLKQVYGEDECS